MLYDLKKVTRAYVKGFYNYIKLHELEQENTEELYDLFSNAINHLYNLESVEYNPLISKYGEDCKKYLATIKNVPKKPERMSLSDRVSISLMCKSYFVAVSLLIEDSV